LAFLLLPTLVEGKVTSLTAATIETNAADLANSYLEDEEEGDEE
jgi:hypothetical protein